MDKMVDNLLDVETQYTAAVEKIFTAMNDIGKKHTYKKNEIFFDFKCDEQNILLIESGTFAFYRQPDRLLIQETSAPAIFGLVMVPHKPDIIISAHSKLSVRSVPRESALRIIEQEGMWYEVAIVLGRIIKVYVERDINLIARDAYHIVKHHLNLLKSLPIEERYSTTAVKFITSRSMLSRSRVMDILKKLNDGEYIIIKNGILNKINFLPDKF
ncbi:helix-turn-helix domain-containing protein [Buttiauxella sp. S04-F03]|uniref:helix-turn-helix domain-containing protein n=1 Tax=Buttiauxella sp. W03-F01 TaxID=2904524 RepID=UPI001E445646|nr:helix-turn-helix domain-containing protein [Buttiauxella sp. W03-F01]MCE0798783.1 helix-turn-helix domain-containing protein [Buttiauxella sp. W03-F01]